MSGRQRYEEEAPPWVPRTKLGQLVAGGKVTSLQEVFENGWKIREPEIVKTLLPNLKSYVVGVGIVQKQTDAGELTRFRAVVAVGEEDGWFGVGHAKAPQMRTAIDKATVVAMLNIIPVVQGCGSWECRCGTNHSVPFRLEGKSGSVKVTVLPAPRGLGLVAGETLKSLLGIAGIKDCWTVTFGKTSTPSSVSNALYDAFLNMYKLLTPTG
ncbi:MAG: 30S ribosomal protein S5 [Nitrososphaerota archaeon]|jgi:small subunit ribosomal protein S5|nr:30S ribosomal protein S5 [Nitrososphaerota archaeon]